MPDERQVTTLLGRVSIVPNGEYSSSTAYKRLDMVQYSGSGYVAVRDVQGVTPADGPDWMLLAAKGNAGIAAGFGDVTATVDNHVGIPSVTVSEKGPDTSKQFRFEFKNLKGEQGVQGPQGEAGPAGPQGIQGPEGPAGPSGVVVELTAGQFAFTIEDGHLILHYTGDEPPAFRLDEETGHLYLNIE